MNKVRFLAVGIVIFFIMGINCGLASSSDSSIYQTQKRLKDLGYNPGKIDGLMGAKTSKAIKQFQLINGLPVTGRLDKRTREKLGLQKAPLRRNAPAPLYSDTRGLKITALDKSTGQQREIKLYNKSYALIIGIDQYKNLPFDMQLSYAVHDAEGVAETLRKNFKFDEIITLYNRDATKDKIFRFLSGELSKISKNDSVFIFWAGHGYTHKTDYGDLGYLVPFDGTFNESELYKNISMTMIKDDISKRIPAKHIFYVMDACYSGLLITKRGAPGRTSRDFSYLKEITKENVRQVLTAGNKNQEVLDGGPKGHSVFTGRFIEILENTDDFITAAEVSSKVKEKVFSDAKTRGHTQTPQYGELFGLGDYVFIPSLEQKVEDTQAELARLLKEKERLEDLESAALQAKDEMARRQAELEKKAVEAKLRAERLRQKSLTAEKKRREQEKAERLRKEQELARKKKEAKLRLAALKREVEAKRKAMAASKSQVHSPAATIKEMRSIDAKIEEIKSAYLNELANALKIVSKQVDPKFRKVADAKKDEFESLIEFKRRKERLIREAQIEQTAGFKAVNKKITDAYNKEVNTFIEALKRLSGREHVLTESDLIMELSQYDTRYNAYPVTIRSQKSIGGVMLACKAKIPIPSAEAKIFKRNFENNILRPEIRGNFQSIDFFRIGKAYVIDDATNKKYDLFSANFIDIGSGIIYDRRSNLLWVKDGNYFKKKMNWRTAKRACERLDLAGLSGWRLPTKRELENLINKDYDPAINPIFDCEPSCYWTSSSSARSGSSLECVLFTYGRISYNINSFLHVRCVRGGQ